MFVQMHVANMVEHYVVARESNVLRVDFSREPDPPAPGFPGAGALRYRSSSAPLEALAARQRREMAKRAEGQG